MLQFHIMCMLALSPSWGCISVNNSVFPNIYTQICVYNADTYWSHHILGSLSVY